MEKLKMHTPDITEENYQKLAALFPNAVTETVNEDGEVVRAIDADVLRQEISATVVEGKKERYQFTWPDKKKSVVLANQPIAKTLRLNREKSVGRDGTPGKIDTENIYIEGDNLDALKLLQETYLGKVKMIYIDPPYNTGSDAFVYDDDFAESAEEFAENSGAVDEDGNRLFDMRVNNESNGRFHTDWLNMMYPRLRLAKDLLADDGVIFISIDDNEFATLKLIGDEIFGNRNFVTDIIWEKSDSPKNDTKFLSSKHDHMLMWSKNINILYLNKLKIDDLPKHYNKIDEDGRYYYLKPLRSMGQNDAQEDRPSLYYGITAPNGDLVFPVRADGSNGRWRWSKNKVAEENKRIEWVKAKSGWSVYYKVYADEQMERHPETIWYNSEVGSNRTSIAEIKSLFDNKKSFDTPKPLNLIKRIIQIAMNRDSLAIDFFSGSATTAHAVMQQNAEDGGNRKFIMVQLPEITADKSEAKKAGYNTICDIGEERIRRAGKKIKEETGKDIDYGFRVFTVDSSNMKDVYYNPQALKQEQISLYADNIKEDRIPEDLLFQVMLDLGVFLSSPIEEKEIAGKKVFSVDGGYLIACFDTDVTEEVVTAIAKEKPFYAVFRDSSMANDSVMTNFEQIFETYSPNTVRKVL